MGVRTADGGDVAEYRAPSAAAGALTAPVMRPETKMPLLPGWNATSKGCSAQRAEHSSPPSLDISRRMRRGRFWSGTAAARAGEEKAKVVSRGMSRGLGALKFLESPPDAVGSRYSLIQIIVFPAPTDAPSPMTSTASSRPTRRVGRFSVPARMSRSHSVAMACLFPLA